MTNSSANEVIFGLDFQPEDYDRLMFKFVRKDWLKHEGPLFTTKWFDYRFMNPVAGAYLYAHEFVKVYRRFYRSTIDYTRAEHVRPLKELDLFACPQEQISAIWRGRQIADAVGMPYDVYLELAMEAALKYWQRAHLPRPAQLYSDRVCEFVIDQWEKRQEGILYYGQHKAFRNQFFINTPTQNDHHEWLLAQISKRGEAGFSLLNDAVENDLLPLEKVKARFGEDLAERILQAA